MLTTNLKGGMNSVLVVRGTYYISGLVYMYVHEIHRDRM